MALLCFSIVPSLSIYSLRYLCQMPQLDILPLSFLVMLLLVLPCLQNIKPRYLNTFFVSIICLFSLISHLFSHTAFTHRGNILALAQYCFLSFVLMCNLFLQSVVTIHYCNHAPPHEESCKARCYERR